MKKFEKKVFVSRENGLKFDVEDGLTAQLLNNPEKKSFVEESSNDKKAKTAKTPDNEQEIG